MDNPIYNYNRDAINSAKLVFIDFLQYDFSQGKYGERVKEMIHKKENRLLINLGDLREFDGEIAKKFLQKPTIYIQAFEQSLKEYIDRLSKDDKKFGMEVLSMENAEFFVGVEGAFGSHHVTPRDLSSHYLGSLVNVEGIVTKASTIQPKLVKSVHYCEKTAQHSIRLYNDSLTGNYPTKDSEGNPLTTEYGYSVFKDYQTLTIQEMPEKAPPGQLPYSVEVIVTDDLVDKCHPGDRVEISGIYKPLPARQGSHTSAIFKSTLMANHLVLQKKDIGPSLNEEDIENIKRMAERQDIYELLSKSLAPSVFGHDFVKKALLLLLVGGVEKNLKNKTHLRGDINILLIGDPSTAKSQLLRFVLHTAPLSVSTTGRGSSGVGLTAAVISDTETGERRLEAGAMVLADRGIVCIDEFDKMSNDDRVAIHEVMEQQTVTIAKAGIHTTLNARCSVLAAANPIYGQYNRQKKPTENIALPDSLLSRFDLLFIVLDTLNPEHDRSISDHVLRMHRYNKGNSELDLFRNSQTNSRNEIGNVPQNKGEASQIFEKFDKLLHGSSQREQHERVLSIDFLKKYILYAKQNVKPVLTEEATDIINQSYVQLRSKDDMKTLPVTARSLETLIRLATAHAKVRLSSEVTEEDAKAAVELMNYALYRDTTKIDFVDQPIVQDEDDMPLRRVKKTKVEKETPETVSTSNQEEEEEEISEIDQLLEKHTQAVPLKDSKMEVDQPAPDARPVAKESQRSQDDNSSQYIRKKLLDYLAKTRKTEALISDFVQYVNTGLSEDEKFTLEEIENEMEDLQSEGKVVLADSTIYQV